MKSKLPRPHPVLAVSAARATTSHHCHNDALWEWIKFLDKNKSVWFPAYMCLCIDLASHRCLHVHASKRRVIFVGVQIGSVPLFIMFLWHCSQSLKHAVVVSL